MISGYALATLNAMLNATAALFMFAGYRAIKRKDRETHKRLMIGAFVASCLFLASYLTRMALYGDTRFGGEGALRILYFAILISHVLLALAAAPMVLRTIYLGLKNRVADHRKIARWTFPIWAYVSVTGVVVYLMLYQL
jgi:putative membrane protein